MEQQHQSPLSKSWTFPSKRATWAGVRNSVFVAANVGFQFISTDSQHDTPIYDDNDLVRTRTGKSDNSSYRGRSRYGADEIYDVYGGQAPSQDTRPNTDDPFDDSYESRGAGEANNPFDDSENVVRDSDQQPGQVVTSEVEPPYHVFEKREKWLVIVIIGVAGLFSGLSSNIYFPALGQIATDLQVSLNTVSLTITSYLIIQGISPVIWGSFSDTLGRRPIYIASFTVYIIANIALSFSPNFAVLLFFRGLQAAGSASTVSIGNGVIQDISPPSERGAFISFYQAIRNFSIAVGPVLGGLFSNFAGFRSIFVFLLILSTLTVLMIAVFLPETLRSIAGNGSLRLTGIHQPLIRRLTKEPSYMQDPDETIPRKKVTIRTFIDPLKLLGEKDILLNLVFGGVVYTIWSMVTSSTTGLFASAFGLNELQIGLVFLPNGLGTIVGSAIVGKLMTADFKAAEVEYKIAHNLPPTHKLSAKNVPVDFPIEYARLRNLPWIAVLFAASTAAYGFSLSFLALVARPGWIAVPLILQFFIAATSNAVFAANQTLVSDLCPGQGASSTAVNNLVRCGLGAVGVAFIETMISAAGVGATFLGLALVVGMCAPLVAVSWYWGMGWRAERTERKARLEAEKEREKGEKV